MVPHQSHPQTQPQRCKNFYVGRIGNPSIAERNADRNTRSDITSHAVQLQRVFVGFASVYHGRIANPSYFFVEIRDPDRNTTPLRYAIVYNQKTMIRLLISRGAEVGAIEENGTTALQLACDAATGAFEEYDDMPSRTEYREVMKLLKELCD